MKRIKTLLFVAMVIAMGATALPANAQFKFGPRVGLTVNDMHFNKKVVDADNQTGWTAGVTGEFTVPVIGIGADLSAMYVRRNAKFVENHASAKDNRDYFEVPLNLKYKFSLPVVSKFVLPYVAMGPSVSFLTSRRSVKNAIHNKSVDWALNFGLGVQLMSHLDLNARYGLGLTKAVRAINPDGSAAGINGKNRYWTISVAYLF